MNESLIIRLVEIGQNFKPIICLEIFTKYFLQNYQSKKLDKVLKKIYLFFLKEKLSES